jgi:RNA polymerase sigma factor (sigma-70 family)
LMSDPLSDYMAGILRYPLLTKEQEIILARQVQAWVTAENPTKKEERIGKRAYQKLINCNLRLVVSIAKRYTNRIRKTDLLDIISEGNIGLAHGVKKFDPERGYALSTYAYWWIRQSITRHISTHDRVIRLPGHAVEMLSKLRLWIPVFDAENGRPPTIQECAEYCKVNPGRMEDYLKHNQDASSLDRVVGAGDNLQLLDTVADELNLLEDLEYSYDRESMGTLMVYLDPEDRSIIEKYFGFNDGQEMTLAGIAKEMGVSRERVRQRFNRGIMKLRTSFAKSRRGEDY